MDLPRSGRVYQGQGLKSGRAPKKRQENEIVVEYSAVKYGMVDFYIPCYTILYTILFSILYTLLYTILYYQDNTDTSHS